MATKRSTKKVRTQAHITAHQNGSRGNSAAMPQNVNRSEQNGRGTV